MATISNTPRPGYVWDVTDNVWYPIGVGGHSHSEIAKTIADAKGDLIVGTAADTVDRLAVGNNGETIVADSAATTGLRYSATPSASNPVLNSAMQIAQRGTSISLAASAGTTYTLDRWCTQTGANQACTVTQQLTGDTTNLPFIQYALRYQRNASQTGTGALTILNAFETVNSRPFAGKAVTFSFYARAGANYSAASSALAVKLDSGTGTDQNPFAGYTGGVTVASTTATLTTTWQRFSATGTVGATAAELNVQVVFTPVGTAGAADYYEITGVQVDVGSVALPFRTYAATIQGELAACQRYFVALPSGSASDNYATFATGYTATTTKGNFVVNLPVPMRIYPTMTYSAGNTFATHTGASTVTAGTAIATDRSSPNTIWCNLTVASGLTAGNALFLIGNNTTSAKIEASAEL